MGYEISKANLLKCRHSLSPDQKKRDLIPQSLAFHLVLETGAQNAVARNIPTNLA